MMVKMKMKKMVTMIMPLSLMKKKTNNVGRRKKSRNKREADKLRDPPRPSLQKS